jgi:adenylate kinase family enzyme
LTGPGGSGKSTFAAHWSVAAGNAPIVHTDDFASADNANATAKMLSTTGSSGWGTRTPTTSETRLVNDQTLWSTARPVEVVETDLDRRVPSG